MPFTAGYTISFDSVFNKTGNINIHTHTHKHTPAQSLDEVLCTSADLLWKFDDINSLEDDVISPHWVWARERRTSGQQFKH